MLEHGGGAQAVASFGFGVGQTATYYVVCLAAMAVIWGVQACSPVVRSQSVMLNDG